MRVVLNTKTIHPASIIVQLRKEERQLQKAFWDLFDDDLAGALSAYDRLLKCRTKLLEIIGWPKPPTLRAGATPEGWLRDQSRAGRVDVLLPSSDPESPQMDSPAAPCEPDEPV
jgi:hypothetical protein